MPKLFNLRFPWLFCLEVMNAKAESQRKNPGARPPEANINKSFKGSYPKTGAKLNNNLSHLLREEQCL
jgi:hypothetical protein